MKILVLMKRFSSGKDQITENFGREVRLFSELQKRGHEVTLLCTDHVRNERISTTLNGMKVEIYPFGMPGILKFFAAARNAAKENDIIVGTSHPLHGIIAAVVAKGKPLIYDVRDNYETYDFTNIPLLKRGLIPRLVNNHVVRRSSLVTCASPELASIAGRHREGPTLVITNGIDLKLYRPLDRNKCRKMLKLPPDDKIITYSGGIRGIGVDLLLKAFKKVHEKDNSTRLMLIGDEIKSKYSDVASPNDKIDVFASVPYERLLYYLNASDVLVVAYEKNEFTKVMYTPYKLMDYMALNKPIVCTDVGDMKKMLAGYEQLICRPNDSDDMAGKLLVALKTKKVNYRSKLNDFTWERLGARLDTAIRAMFKNAGEAQ